MSVFHLQDKITCYLSKVAGHKINTQKSVAFLYTTRKIHRRNYVNNSLYNRIKKFFRNKFYKQGERLLH